MSRNQHVVTRSTLTLGDDREPAIEGEDDLADLIRPS